MSYFKAKMHQIRFRLGLRPRPRWGSLQCSSDLLAGFLDVLLREGREMEEEDGRGGREWRGRERGSSHILFHSLFLAILFLPSPPVFFLFQSRPGDEILDLNDEQIFFLWTWGRWFRVGPCKCFGEFQSTLCRWRHITSEYTFPSY